ncbi:polysaccharide deacetylase family protein [Streptomyces sp. NBC_01198]|uniref:polysaccharide deacetylase family protein n=1 Tax=Streptomyces sp. NBC_01198 TaxID=2903769 RepID=UPI002E0F20DD|nr:polysaccharide deacetylase family protein [Streptomyces sp. NBC_01198]
MRAPRGKTAVLLLLGLLFTAGCSAGTPAGSPAPRDATTASPTTPPASKPSPTDDRAAGFRKWGLPLLPPPPAPPAVKPIRTGDGKIPAVSDIPTTQKIVFLTFDDGAEKDPKFVGMMRDLKIPFTMFLTDDIIKNDYGFFRPLQALGNTIENHTLSHPDLHGRTLAQQKHEICTQQQKLTHEYGKVPGLFRPPYGNYNTDTRAAVKSCGGLRAMILWRESMQIKKVQFQRPDKKFHPGDIILAHFRGPAQLKGETMTKMVANLLRQISSQGFTLARLEDYV